MKKTSPLRVLVVGAGKVGKAVASSLRASGALVEQVRARSPRPRSDRFDACLIATRDRDVGRVAIEVSDRIGTGIPILHTAGASGPELLEEARKRGAPTGQMHPLLSFVGGVPPAFEGAWALVSGDARALRAARRVARALGLRVLVDDALPRGLYHAAAALAANGTAALAHAASSLLVSGGLTRRTADQMLGPLLASVAQNVARAGSERALSGPIRRGDAPTIARHLGSIGDSTMILDLYLASARAQLAIARTLGDASSDDLDAVERLVASSRLVSPSAAARPKDLAKHRSGQVGFVKRVVLKNAQRPLEPGKRRQKR